MQTKTIQDRYEQLLKIATEDERGKLITLHEACLKLHESYRGNPQADTKKSWDAAERGKRETIDLLWEKYYQHEPVFTDRKAVLAYLDKQGYKIKKTKLYEDARKGILKVEPDGRVLEIAVRAYMGTLDKKVTGDPAEKTAQKIDEEIKGLKLKNERQQIELDALRGKYILQSDVEMELISRIVIFDSCFRTFINTQTPALIDACAGNRTRTKEVQDMLNRELDKLLNAMADVDKFQITFQAGGPEDKALEPQCTDNPEAIAE